MIQHVQAEIKTKKLLFVDSGVADVESLLFGLESGYTVIPLCNDSDPITQLSTAIALHAPVDEMVIVAHAEPGRIIFAGQSIDVIALEQHGQELADWRSDLTEDAGISIYACQLAAGEIGRDFLQLLGCLTGAKVASSTLPIGNLGAYQNWHLDHYTHAFDAPLPFHEKAMAAYQHTLAPVISIDRIASVLSVIEGASGSRQMEFVVTLSEPATSTVDILYRTLDEMGTATGGIDYTEEASFVRIFAGQSSATINITVAGDSADEVDESVVLELFNPENAVFPGGAPALRATGVILDDDGGASNLALFVSQVQVVEGNSGGKQAVFEVQLSRPSTDSVTLNYTTADGSATAGQDYQAQSGTLTFAPGETLKTVAVPVIGDTVAEANEFFNLVFTPTAAIANGVTGAVGTAVILDDDTSSSLPEISLSGGRTIEGASGSRQMEFVVTLSEPATSTVDILYRTLDEMGTATGGIDYTEEASFVRIFAGQSSATINITVAGDSADEVDESVVLELFNPENAVFPGGAPALRATGVILDDDGGASNLALFVSQVQVVEGNSGGKQAVFEVQLSRPSTDSVTLNYTTADGSATAGQDYQAQSGTLTFAPGETLKTVAVPVIGDTVAEANEFFNLVFTPTAAIANGVTGAVGTAVILDDDTSSSLPEISLSGGRTIEGASGSRQMEFVVTLSEPATSTVDILYRTLDEVGTATGGIDYTEEASFVRIFAGQSSATINITVAGDSADEVDESVVLELFNPENAVFPGGAPALRATGVILDDDGSASNLALFVSQVQVVEGNSGGKQAVFEVQLSRPSTDSVTLNYTTADGSATAGQDYQAQSGTLTFAPGETLKTVAVPVIGDTVAEANEFFNLVFTPTAAIANGVTGAVGTAVILDDDTSSSLPEISLSGGRTIEGASGSRQMEFVVTLSEPATSTVDILYRTLDEMGTATGGIDYTEEASFVRIFAGQSSATINITVAGDSADEVDESVVLELFNPENAVFPGGAPALRATGVILDDDGSASNLALFVSQVQVVEGNSGGKQAVFEVQLSRPSTDSVTLNYTTADGSATAGQDYQAQSGTLTFAPGETLKTVAVPVIGDTVAEANEFFNLVFTPTAAIANGVTGAVGTAVILDDDTSSSLPEISLSGGRTIEGASGSRQMEFVVTLSEPATSTVDILYRTLDEMGTATGGIDYTEEASFVRIFAGQSSATINITVAGDSADEVDESVVLELFNPENAVFPGGVNTLQAIGFILDDDGADNNLGLFVGNAQIVEGANGVTREVAVPIHLSRPSDQTLTFQYQTADGAAIGGQDYTSQTGTVTFLPGQTLAAVMIPVIGDAIDEPSETFTLTVTPTAAIANGTAGATGTITIIDGNAPGAPGRVKVNVGNSADIDEGSVFSRSITFSDGEDSGNDGWTYSVDWGDGSAAETGSVEAGVSSFDISRLLADGDASHNVSVTVTDVAGDSDTQQFQLGVNNVAPVIALHGADSVNVGASYTLDLGAVTDPGQDTVTSYIVNWGDGSSDTFSNAGQVTHAYADPGNNTISVDLVDEDGTHTNAGSLTIAVGIPPADVSVNAGGNATFDEGSVFSRSITFSDGEDSGNDGWTYSVDWGDGSAAETGSVEAGVSSFDISRLLADGDASHNVSVTVTDVAGDSDTQQFQLGVNNVAPVIALHGADSVNVGASYTLDLGAVTDPGQDTVTSYIVNWGDGSSDTFSNAGQVTHAYADPGNNTISVDLVDEDGTHTNAGSLTIAVGIPPADVSVNAGGNATLDEGSVFSRSITFSDGEDSGNDGWTYSVDWGDGSAAETGSVEAGVSSFDISRLLADGDASHNVSVTVTDVAGDSDTQQFQLGVNNVAPVIALHGADSVNVGASYTLDLGAVTDPGQDTVTSYIVNWGDGSSDTFSNAGQVTHAYADPGNNTISVDLVDEDGTHTNAGSLTIAVGIPPADVSVNAGGNATLDEGSVFSRSITFSDGEDSGNDGWTYSVDWGDGSAAETGSVEAGVSSFDISRLLADGDASHNVSVTVTDVAGDSDTQQFQLGVNNVAPVIALHGADSVNVGASYTLDLGAVTDPGQDTVTSYIVNWGDGSSDTFSNAGQVTHAYADPGNNTISVDLVDEDGTHTNAGSLTIAVGIPPADVSVNAGGNATLDEGSVFSRSITFSDGEDSGNDGWTYSVDWGDGSAAETGSVEAGVSSFDISRLLADGDASHNVSVTVTDVAGDSDTQQFQLGVNNVAPVIALHGADSVNVGASYTLDLGAVTDPGQDTVTSYIVNWGDGSSDTFSNAGQVTHAYADPGNNTISVDLVDEDGTHTNAGSLTIAVGIPPADVSVNAGGNATLDEGSVFSRSITFSDGEDSGNDGWTYSVDWGDGSAAETGSVEAGVSSFDISRLLADGDASHNVSVTVTDVAGDSDTQQFQLGVNNVAPVIALHGADSVNVGASYTLDLGAVTDPGQDTVTSYIVNWGDGSSDTFSNAGQVTHAYADPGNNTISVDLVDEDGTHTNAGSLGVQVNDDVVVGTVRIGDAPMRITKIAQLVDAWSDPVVDTIVHKADASNPNEAWSAVTPGILSTQFLAGGDLYAGDLGVSGRSVATSSIAQELDGTETLRFEFTQAASAITVSLSRLFSNDESSIFSESGRLRLFDADGDVVGETTFVADTSNGKQLVSVASEAKFTAVEFNAGAYDGGEFSFGGLASTSGEFATDIFADASGKLYGSDYLIDWIEPTFEISLVGVGDIG